MNRAEKTAVQEEMSSTIGKAPHAFLIDYQGINVVDVTELRRQIRAAKSEYVVIKNTLALRALKDAPIGQLSQHFTGMTAVAYSETDVVSLAKVLHTFGKTNPHVKIKGAIVEGRTVPAGSLEALATMPSRHELLTRLAGLLTSPMRRLVTVLSGPQRGLAMTLAAIAQTKEKSEASAS